MTELPIPSGPTNREIIDRAYQVLGLSDSMFGRSDDEYAAAMLPLGGMMLEWPFDQLGYIYEDAAGMRTEEESGIARKYLDTVGYCLAERLAPMLGKTLAPAMLKVKNGLYSRLCADVSTPTEATYRDGTIRGAGARYPAFGTFFPQG